MASPRFWSSAMWRSWQMNAFSPTYLRNATAYGVSPRLRLDIVLNDLVASAYTTGRVYIKSDGTPWRPIVHIRDIVAAILSVPGSAAGICSQRDLQCRTDRRKLPHSRTGRHRRRDCSRLPHRICSRRRSGQTLLPHQLRQDPACPARASVPSGPPAKERRNCTMPIGPRGLTPRISRAAATSVLATFGGCSRRDSGRLAALELQQAGSPGRPWSLRFHAAILTKQ